MKAAAFHMPPQAPGTVIRLDPDNGGGFLLACPCCCTINFVKTGSLLIYEHHLIDTLCEIECPSCHQSFWMLNGTYHFDELPQPKELQMYGRAA